MAERTLVLIKPDAIKRRLAGEILARFERRFGSFSRSLAVPAGVTEDAVQADYRDGVLEVRVAKPAAPKPRRIKLGSGHPTIEATPEQE